MRADSAQRTSSSIEDDIALLRAGKEPVWAPRAGKRPGRAAAFTTRAARGTHAAPCTSDARGTPAALALDPRWPAPLLWSELSDRDRQVYEIGFLTGFLMREDEVAQANSDADRYYRIAFDRVQRGRRR